MRLKPEEVKKYTEKFKMSDGNSAVLRPILPEDAPLEREMFRHFSEETQRFRFFARKKTVTHEIIKRYTDIDYDVEFAVMAEVKEKGKRMMAGVARFISDDSDHTAEFAVVVADPWQGKGLGRAMTDKAIEIAKERGIGRLFTYFLPDNERMRKMLKHRGFTVKDKPDCCFAVLDLKSKVKH